MRIDIVRQAVTKLAAVAADAVLPPTSLEVLQTQRIHPLGIPDILHRLLPHIADHQLAAPVQKA